MDADVAGSNPVFHPSTVYSSGRFFYMDMFSTEQAQQLISLARESILAGFDQAEFDPQQLESSFKQKQGCFTTIYLNSTLKGCIGLPFADVPLSEAISSTAVSAAFKDPRFSPLERAEFDTCTIELNILSPLELIKIASPAEYPSAFTIGKHGLYVINAFNRRGLLLPDVAVKHQWNPKEFLNQTCRKANLPKIAWLQDTKLKIYRFSSIILEEVAPFGSVIIR